MIQPLPISEEQMCTLYFQVSLNEVSWVASFVLCFCISQEGTNYQIYCTHSLVCLFLLFYSSSSFHFIM